MSTCPLDVNLSRYPKLRNLLDPDLTSRSKFLYDMNVKMHKYRMTYGEVLAACKVIDEKRAHVSAKGSS